MTLLNCPNCQDNKLIPIIYGKPGTKLLSEAALGEVELRGCVIQSEELETHTCGRCHSDWIQRGEATFLSKVISVTEMDDVLTKFTNSLRNNVQTNRDETMARLHTLNVANIRNQYANHVEGFDYIDEEHCSAHFRGGPVIPLTAGYQIACRGLLINLISLAKSDYLHFSVGIGGTRRWHIEDVDAILVGKAGYELERYYGALVTAAAGLVLASMGTNSVALYDAAHIEKNAWEEFNEEIARFPMNALQMLCLANYDYSQI